MKNKHNAGYTLVELLISIAILAVIVLPTCTSMVLSYRMNAKTDDLLQAQLSVSSAVETLMARGITEDFLRSLEADEKIAGEYTSPEFPGMVFTLAIDSEETKLYYAVTVKDAAEMASVDTIIRNASDKTLTEILKEEGGAGT